MESPLAETVSENPIAAGVVVVITTDHWVREWFEQLIIPDLAASGKTIEFFDISDQRLFDDHVEKLVEILKSGFERNMVCFACTDCAMDVYSCAAECLANERNPPRGASFPCFFLATNKLATRQCIAGCGGLQSRPVRMEDAELPMLGDGIDGFFKPIAECGSRGVMKCVAGVTVANPLFQPLSDTKRRRTNETIKKRLASHYPELDPYVDEGLVGLVEEYVRPSDARKVSLDGFIFQKSIHHYSISENIYKADAPEVFDSIVTPAQGLREDELQACWALYDKVAEDMIRRGLDNQFFDVEAFLMLQTENTTPRVEVMEVNCRTFANQLPAFSKMFGPERSMFAAAVSLLFGRRPSIEGDFAAKVMNGSHDYSRHAVGVCCYVAQIPGAPVIVHDEQGNATYFAVDGFPAHVYAYAQDPTTARRLCDTFHADLSARFSNT